MAKKDFEDLLSCVSFWIISAFHFLWAILQFLALRDANSKWFLSIEMEIVSQLEIQLIIALWALTSFTSVKQIHFSILYGLHMRGSFNSLLCHL